MCVRRRLTADCTVSSSSSSSSSSQYFYCAHYSKAMGALHGTVGTVRIQLSNIERRTKITSFEKLPKVWDVRFCTNVLRQSVARRRTSVRKGALAELGDAWMPTFNRKVGLRAFCPKWGYQLYAQWMSTLPRNLRVSLLDLMDSNGMDRRTRGAIP